MLGLVTRLREYLCVSDITEISRITPRDGPHSYVTIAVTLPEDVPPPSVTPGAGKHDRSEETLAQPVKYCR